MQPVRLRIFDHSNFHRLDPSLGHGASLFIGDNAESKTSLLESVYLLATMKELRAETEAHVIRREVTGEPIWAARGTGGGILSVTAPSGRVVGVNVRSSTQRSVTAGEAYLPARSRLLHPHHRGSVVPEALQVVVCALFPAEQVHDDVTVVKERPAGAGLALAAHELRLIT